MIELSFNEVETLAAKAARGAGYGWGLAEDIGRAAAALAREGRDWSGDLLRLLEEAPGFVVSGAAGPRCPALMAAWVADAPPEGELRLADVARPVWLDALLRLRGEYRAEGDLEAARADVVVRRGRLPRPPAPGRPVLTRERLEALGALAARTYVPESESSRTRGAGGGRVDDE